MENSSEVKTKIELRYDKMELENKLAEMTRTIMNFKSACNADSVASLPRSKSSAECKKRQNEGMQS